MFPLWILFNWQICTFQCADWSKFSHIHFKSNNTYPDSQWSDLLENDRVIQCMLSIFIFTSRTRREPEGWSETESIELFIEDQTFQASYDLAPIFHLPSACEGRSQIMRRRESLVVYKSFNTLWSETGYCIAQYEPNYTPCPSNQT